MFFISEWYVLPAAFLLDLILGDPFNMPHPVRWMGKGIERLEPWFRKNMSGSEIAGLFFAVTLIISAWGIASGLLFLVSLFSSFAGSLVEIILIYYCISALSLKKAALDVVRALREEGLAVAKKRLAFIVGRDVDKLDSEGVSRAALETVAENLVDGVISPLFWAAVGGAPFAIAYKMINTLDSMVGYKNEKYREFGMVSAKIDDLANYIPARISVAIITIAAWVLGFDGKSAFRTAVVDGRNHSSPNAGFPEAAFSGALKVKLGGPNYYGDLLVNKPYIGESFGPVSMDAVTRACQLLICSAWVALVVSMVIAHIAAGI